MRVHAHKQLAPLPVTTGRQPEAVIHVWGGGEGEAWHTEFSGHALVSLGPEQQLGLEAAQQLARACACVAARRRVSSRCAIIRSAPPSPAVLSVTKGAASTAAVTAAAAPGKTDEGTFSAKMDATPARPTEATAGDLWLL